MYVTLAPARIGTAAVFNAADPWNGGHPATFQLDYYAMVPRGARHASPNTPANRRLLGLCSGIDRCDRLLPESLTELWRLGEISAEQLPSVLHAIEPHLKKSDLRFYLHPHPILPIMGVILEILCGAMLWTALTNVQLKQPWLIALVIAGAAEIAFVTFILPRIKRAGRLRQLEQWKRQALGLRIL